MNDEPAEPETPAAPAVLSHCAGCAAPLCRLCRPAAPAVPLAAVAVPVVRARCARCVRLLRPLCPPAAPARFRCPGPGARGPGPGPGAQARGPGLGPGARARDLGTGPGPGTRAPAPGSANFGPGEAEGCEWTKGDGKRAVHVIIQITHRARAHMSPHRVGSRSRGGPTAGALHLPPHQGGGETFHQNLVFGPLTPQIEEWRGRDPFNFLATKNCTFSRWHFLKIP